jgi:elongation factor G
MEVRGKNQVIKAQVPMARCSTTNHTQLDHRRARLYHMEFSHYDPVPGQIAQKVIEQSRADGRIRTEEEE